MKIGASLVGVLLLLGVLVVAQSAYVDQGISGAPYRSE